MRIEADEVRAKRIGLEISSDHHLKSTIRVDHTSRRNRSSPPRIALRFFRWYCHPRLADHIEGDLMELYIDRVKKHGKRKADWKFILDVLTLFRPKIIGPLSLSPFQQMNTNMIRSYMVVAIRNLLRHKLSGGINVAGCLQQFIRNRGQTRCVFQILYYPRHLHRMPRIVRSGY